MDFLYQILDNSEYAVLSAFILGIMTAISPCPLATNISAIGFISRDVESKNRVFISGLIYTLGRAFTYTLIAVILYFGSEQLNISYYIQQWGEKLLGPLLLIIGLFMLGAFNFIKLPSFSNINDKLGEKAKKSYWGSFLLGAAFALAFCPTSAVFYFIMLIPMTIASPSGLALPVVYAIGTALPVIIFAWLLAYAVGNVGKAYNKIQVFELWFRRIVAILFIGVGLYFCSIYFI